MPMQLYRANLNRWVNQELGANAPGLGATDLLLQNILVELRVISALLDAQQPGTSDVQNLREDITKSNYPLNAF